MKSEHKENYNFINKKLNLTYKKKRMIAGIQNNKYSTVNDHFCLHFLKIKNTCNFLLFQI